MTFPLKLPLKIFISHKQNLGPTSTKLPSVWSVIWEWKQSINSNPKWVGGFFVIFEIYVAFVGPFLWSAKRLKVAKWQLTYFINFQIKRRNHENREILTFILGVWTYLEISEPYSAVQIRETQDVIVKRLWFRMHIWSSEHLKICSVWIKINLVTKKNSRQRGTSTVWTEWQQCYKWFYGLFDIFTFYQWNMVGISN